MSLIDRRLLLTTLAIKHPVRVATTADITLRGLQTIDGVVLVAGDRVLVKDQDDGSENGIYRAASGAWDRDQDFNDNSDFVQGTRVYVVLGTVNVGTEYQLTTANPDLGSGGIAFATSGAYSGALAAQAAAEAAADATLVALAAASDPQRREDYAGIGGATLYASSEDGDDSNLGTLAAPVQTLSRLAELAQSSDLIFLKRGSVFREQFEIPVASTVRAYGQGEKPIISGADLLANASFSLVSGKVNTYQISLPSIPLTSNPYASVTNSDVLMVWEDDTRLGERFVPMTSINDVEGSAGSFWWDSAGKLLYVHASGSSNVVSNGKVYEASVRTLAIHGGDGFVVEGLIGEKAYAKTSAGQQGYGIMGYRSGVYRDCVGRQAWNHAGGVANAELCGDLLFDRCEFSDCERNTTLSPPTVFVAFKSSGAPTRVIVRDCIAKQLSASPGGYQEIGFFAHGTSIVCQWEGVNYAENVQYGAQIQSDGGSGNFHVLQGTFVTVDCVIGAALHLPNISLSLIAKSCHTAVHVRQDGCRLALKTVDCTVGVDANGFGTPMVVTLHNSKILRSVAPGSPSDGQGVGANGGAQVLVTDTLFHNIGHAYGGNGSNEPIADGSDNNWFSSCTRIYSDTSYSPSFSTDLADWQSVSDLDASSSAVTQTVSFGDLFVPTEMTAQAALR